MDMNNSMTFLSLSLMLLGISTLSQVNPVAEDMKDQKCLYKLLNSSLNRICKNHGTDEVPLLKCRDCGLVVHQLCYGIKEVTTPWTCWYCQSNKEISHCDLCKKVNLIENS